MHADFCHFFQGAHNKKILQATDNQSEDNATAIIKRIAPYHTNAQYKM